VKILNLYCGIGGNRRLWGDDHDVTGVEFDPKIAAVYQQLYPNDTVVVGDAVEFLEKNFADYDLIWASPPCPSHGQYRHNVGVLGKGFDPVMPDMTLYAQIIFLQHYAKGKWVVENVKPYYEPLITPTFEMQRHLFWSNFHVPSRSFDKSDIRNKNKISDFDGYEVVGGSAISNKRQVLRNCVNPEVGLYILENAMVPDFLKEKAPGVSRGQMETSNETSATAITNKASV
jgi:DNA (cytosine-5)-methyltransferase 1